MTDKQPPKKQPARKTPAKKVAPVKKAVPAKKAAPPAVKKAAPKKKRIQNPAPKHNAPTPPGKAAAARKVAAKKAASVAGKPDQSQAKENAAKNAVSALLGEAKRAVGRPTKYSDDIIPQMLAYFDIETERIEEVARKDKEGVVLQDKEGNVLTEQIKVINKYPTMERFASKIGVNRDTLLEWATAKREDGTPLYPEFSGTYTRCKDLQTALLVEGGLEGNYEARIVQFALKNIAGWRDQIEQTITADITTTDNAALDAIYEQGIRNAAAKKQAALTRKLIGIIPGQSSESE